ncbi:BP74-related protein [Catenuloplanes japonicus]|uniref:BP74-related protein n=1 Tax=Catenuloplanes japonicus TaxID=33876 RepID=UPI00068B4FAC|nr:hypothetical protein [Catenuloplanes japonicus]
MQKLRTRIGGLVAAAAIAFTGVAVTPAPAQAAVVPAFFSVSDITGKLFVIKLVDQLKIDQARAILDGNGGGATHILGLAKPTAAAYNPGFNYHLDPSSITFFQTASTLCDTTFAQLNTLLGGLGGLGGLTGLLPGLPGLPISGLLVCPSTSTLIAEVSPF